MGPMLEAEGYSVKAIVFCPAYFIPPAYLADPALWKYPIPICNYGIYKQEFYYLLSGLSKLVKTFI